MKKERIEKAIEVIDFAIKNNISVREASKRSGFAGTYVKNIKALVHQNYEDGTIDIELFNSFNNMYGKYTLLRDTLKGLTLKTDGNYAPEPELSYKIPDKSSINNSGEQTKLNVDGSQAEIEWKSGSNYPADHIKTLDQLLDICEVDREIWAVKNYVVNKWDVTAIVNDIPQTYQNFQVKAWLEKNKLNVREREIGELFIDMVKNYEPPVYKVNDVFLPTSKENNNLLEISIFDLHLGKLAWGGETFENYDTKIARERFLTSIEKLLHRANGFEYSRILFPVGNDFFNSDNIFNTTTKGTQQDEDLRWQKTFNVGVRLLVDAINLLKQTGVPVDVVVIPGNHDFERSYYMGKYLEAWFNNDPMVAVNNGASPRKYYRFGNVLLGLTHGSEEKESSLPMLMANDIESKPMWSETKFHEWHVGHIHRKRNIKYEINKTRELNEDHGVTIRYMSSLTGIEEWHHKKGFVGSTKAADAFIWNIEFGLVAHLNTNLIIE